MRLFLKENKGECGLFAARYIANLINGFVPTAGRPNFVLGLPTGSTPLSTYRELIRMHEAGEVSFKEVVTFNMDEYVGLPREHEQSYR
jgi:glucosamine-6-phosphate deaminase